MVAHVYKLSSWEVEAGEPKIQVEPGLFCKTLVSKFKMEPHIVDHTCDPGTQKPEV